MTRFNSHTLARVIPVLVIWTVLPTSACRLLKRTPASTATASVSDVPFKQISVDNEPANDRTFYGDVKGIGDIDGDGYPDIVLGGHELVWYAYPSWTKSVVSISMQFTTDMQLADIDGDGDLDIIVPEEKKGQICWFENPRPSGDVHKMWPCHLVGYQGDVTHDVEIADMNGDGKLDIVTRRPTIVWFQNNPDSFTPVPIKTSRDNGEGTALADVNGDGRIDIIQNGYWLENPIEPLHESWVKHVISQELPAQLSVAAVDINGDETTDVVFAPAESTGRICWYQGRKRRNAIEWIEHVIDDDVAFVHSLQVGDYNNDGVLDIATAEMHQSPQRRVAVYLRAGSQWKKQILSTKGSHNLRAGDIGSDGDLDLIGANWGGEYHPLELWENKLIDLSTRRKDWTYVHVDARRAKWGDYDRPGYVRYFGLNYGDINADGFQDVISGRYAYLNPGNDLTRTWTRRDFGVNVDGMLAVDIDEDGQADVIAESLPGVYWLKPLDRDGKTWKAALIGTIPATEHINSQGYVLAQIVRGGRPEIVLTGGDGIYYFQIPKAPEAGNWPRIKIAGGTSEEGVSAGDIDGNGEIDIAAAAKDGRSIYWWKNPGNGAGDWVRVLVGSTQEWADRCVIADINQDGRMDIVISEETAYAGASVYWFEQPTTAQAGWIRHRIVTQFSTNSMDVADMDGDGDADIITAEHRGTRKLAIWRNMGRGSSWMEDLIDAGKESHLGARVADLNRDGRADIFAIGWDTYAHMHLWTPALTPTRTNPRVQISTE
jgi:hypothetical protein